MDEKKAIKKAAGIIMAAIGDEANEFATRYQLRKFEKFHKTLETYI